MLGHNCEMGRLAEEGCVVDGAQVNQELGAGPGRVDLEYALAELGEAGQGFRLEARAEPGLEQAHAVRLQGNSDLVMEERNDGREVELGPRLGWCRKWLIRWPHVRSPRH